MKSRHLALATCAVISSISIVATSTATADEFHGHWVKGRILETYNRLGGYNTFGNANTEELNAANGGSFRIFSAMHQSTGTLQYQTGLLARSEGRSATNGGITTGNMDI